MDVDRAGLSRSHGRRIVEPLVSVPFLAPLTNVCRSRFQSSALAFGSNDPVGTLQIISAWLRNWIASQVGHFAVLRWADNFVIYSLDLERSALTDGSNDPVGVLRGDFGWPHGVCVL